MSFQLVGSLARQPDRVWCAVPHPQLPLLATASTDRAVRIYSLRDFSLVTTIEGGHKRSIRSLAWKPNTRGETVLATASFDSTTGIWRKEERSETNGLDDGEKAKDGRDEDEDDDEWRFAVVLDGHDSEVKSVAWSPGGSFLATCSRDKSVWIWEEMNDDYYETIAVLQEHTQDVKMVVWHPTEEILASASYDDTIRLYKEDVDDWSCCAVLTGHTSTVWSIAFENAGPQSRIASASDDQTARIWRRNLQARSAQPNAPPSILHRDNEVAEEWEEQSCLPKAHTRTIYSIAWSPISGLVATVGGDGRIVVYQEGVESTSGAQKAEGSWRVVSQIDGAHGAAELNHVSWARRWDGEDHEKDEILITAGDDGVVNIFSMKL